MKRIVLSMIIMIALVLAGCTNKGDTGPKLQDPFVGGTDGIIISFEEDAPPDEVYDGGDFPFGIVVKLENDGEFAVPKEDATVTISGILSSEFDKEEAELTANPDDNLEATKKDSEGTVVESNPVYVEFDDLNHVGVLTGNTQYTVRADVCYKYGTTANSRLCIRKDNLDTDDAVCEVNEDKEVFSSGAPVQIKDFKETARAKDKVGFQFTIEHKGNGLIYQQDTNCDTSTRAYEDKVWVEVVTDIPGLDCSGLKDGTATSGYTTLYGNEKPIICTQEVSTSSDYEKPVVINLRYDYKDSKEETLLVKHALE